MTDSVKAMHCLPVPYRIKLKLCVLMHAVVIGTRPVYIKDILTPTKDIAGRSHLRSAAAGDFSVAIFRLEFGRRAFSVAGPMEWNALPAQLRTIKDRLIFKRALKTHLFKMAYNC